MDWLLPLFGTAAGFVLTAEVVACCCCCCCCFGFDVRVLLAPEIMMQNTD